MRTQARRYIDDHESRLLRYELSLINSRRVIKKALQRLCTHYESGKRLRDPTEHRQLIHSHLGSDDVLLRRWSIKALGLIADPDDVARLVASLRNEADFEALTWGAAALVNIQRDRSMAELCAQAGLERTTPFWLAARLYAPREWLNQHWKPVTISPDSDELTLKWATFLAGYGRASEDLFGRHDGRVFLSELNKHSVAEVSEYSIWALWQHPDYGFSDLSISPSEFLDHPENARKWLYRVIAKRSDQLQLDSDMIEEFRRKDTSPSAREGLALALADCHAPPFDTAILDWYDSEKEEGIRDILLTTMAIRSDTSDEFSDIVALRFKDELPDSRLRNRLLAAAAGTNLYGALRQMDAQDQFAKQGLFEYLRPNGIIVEGDVYNMGSSLNVGGNLTAQNVVAGDVVSSAVSAVQSTSNPSDQALLERVLNFLSTAQVPPEEKAKVAEAVEAVAKDPSPKAKIGVLSALKGVAGLIGTSASLAELISAVEGWLS